VPNPALGDCSRPYKDLQRKKLNSTNTLRWGLRGGVSETNKLEVIMCTISSGTRGMTFLIPFKKVVEESSRSKSVRWGDTRNKGHRSCEGNSNKSRGVTI